MANKAKKIEDKDGRTRSGVPIYCTIILLLLLVNVGLLYFIINTTNASLEKSNEKNQLIHDLQLQIVKLSATKDENTVQNNSINNQTRAKIEIAPKSRKYKREDIVCGVITATKYHGNRAKAVKDTWGPLCGAVLYFSSTSDNHLPTVVLEGSEEGKIINEKVFRGFQYMWEHFPEKKWFIKADDDTYINFDNLLDLLEEYDHTKDAYIGRAGEWGGGDSYVRYCGGGAGYVISQTTMQKWYPHIKNCQRLPVGEDVSVGKCLRDKVNVLPSFRTGFYHRIPEFFLTTDMGRRDHPEGLTPRPITFHSVLPERMYEIHYLVHTITAPLEEVDPKWRNNLWPTSSPTH